jgi:hypothetical protein
MNKQRKYPLIGESLAENDLKWLVGETAYIDMYKTKLGEDKDYIVLALTVNDRQPAHDLASFIENSVHEFTDVEVSPATDSKGRYLVYVELERNPQAFGIIKGILTDANKLSGITNWQFRGMRMNQDVEFNQENFAANIITDPAEYERRFPKVVDNEDTQETTESIKQRLNFLMKY